MTFKKNDPSFMQRLKKSQRDGTNKISENELLMACLVRVSAVLTASAHHLMDDR